MVRRGLQLRATFRRCRQSEDRTRQHGGRQRYALEPPPATESRRLGTARQPEHLEQIMFKRRRDPCAARFKISRFRTLYRLLTAWTRLPPEHWRAESILTPMTANRWHAVAERSEAPLARDPVPARCDAWPDWGRPKKRVAKHRKRNSGILDQSWTGEVGV